MYRKLLVPLDGSPTAEQALPAALGAAERYGASVVLARAVVPIPHVVPDPTLTTGAAAPLISDAWASAREEAERYLGEARRLLPRGAEVETVVLEGPPEVALIEYAGEAGVELFVLTDHGETGAGSSPFGGVAQTIVHNGRVPVLLVPTR